MRQKTEIEKACDVLRDDFKALDELEHGLDGSDLDNVEARP